MTTDQKANAYHHYVPQFALRKFIDSSDKLCLYSKVTGEIKKDAAPKSTAGVRGFYTNEQGSAVLEKDLSRLETRAARPIQDVVADPGCLSTLPVERLEALRCFCAVQAARTPRGREHYRTIVAGLPEDRVRGAVERNSEGEATLDSELLYLYATMEYYSHGPFGEWNMGTLVSPEESLPLPDTGFVGFHEAMLEDPFADWSLQDAAFLVVPLSPKVALTFRNPEAGAALGGHLTDGVLAGLSVVQATENVMWSTVSSTEKTLRFIAPLWGFPVV